MPNKLNDNRGPYNPNRDFDDFSKAFIIRYIRELMSDYTKMAEFWALECKKAVGQEKLKEI